MTLLLSWEDASVRNEMFSKEFVMNLLASTQVFLQKK